MIDNKYNLEEAGEYLGVSRSSMYKYTQSRKLGYYKIGKSLFFTKEDLDKFRNHQPSVYHPSIVE